MADVFKDPSMLLHSGIPISDEKGNPTTDFLRKWNSFTNTVDTVTTQIVQQQTNVVQRIIKEETKVPHAILSGRISVGL